MGQYCFARSRLSSSVTLSAGGPAAGRVGGRHCTAGQYGYVPWGRHFVYFYLFLLFVQAKKKQKRAIGLYT